MKLDLWRLAQTGPATIGELDVDGQLECVSLEDLPHPEKIAGQTRIPAGQYDVMITYSPRFKRLLPLLTDVPGFDGIRIHPGNTAEDTAGCILVGTTIGDQAVLNSRVAFDALYAKLEQAWKMGDTITIAVHDEGRP